MHLASLVRAAALVVASAGLLACRAPETGSVPSRNSSSADARNSAPLEAGEVAPAPPTSGPPPVERACKRDDECAVARIEPAGAQACCPACATTPGTRRWHAALQRYCGAHQPTTCSPLACPMGATRAICEAGECKTTLNAPDGATAYVAAESRCLPALVCDTWAGCALAVGNAQDGWFVAESKRAARGETAALDRVAVMDAGAAEALRLFPPGVVCLPHSIPPILPLPPSCVSKAGHCVESKGP